MRNLPLRVPVSPPSAGRLLPCLEKDCHLRCPMAGAHTGLQGTVLALHSPLPTGLSASRALGPEGLPASNGHGHPSRPHHSPRWRPRQQCPS